MPFTITDQGSKTGQLYGVYLQDEWKLTPTLTLNYGARYDVVRAFTQGIAAQPARQSRLERDAADHLPHRLCAQLHAAAAGADRAGDVALFNGTTKQSQIQHRRSGQGRARALFRRRRRAALQRRLQARRSTLITRSSATCSTRASSARRSSSSPFNYAKGYAWGVELSGNYTHGPIDLYANVARGEEKAKNIISAQYFFAPDELAYIHDHYIFTDHSQKWTASGGGSYTIQDGIGTLVPTADFIYASGLRTDDPNGIVPNGGELPCYCVFNAGIAQNFTGPGALKGVTIRADVLNLFDKKYQIRSGAGVGVGAPQWGQRRGFFAGITKNFLRKSGPAEGSGRAAGDPVNYWTGACAPGESSARGTVTTDSMPAAIASSLRTRSLRSAISIRPLAGRKPAVAGDLGQLHPLELEPAVPGLEPGQARCRQARRCTLARQHSNRQRVHHFSSCRSASISRASSSFWVLM